MAAPENRLNLALFGLLSVTTFRSWFLQRLSLPSDSVVYPPKDTAGLRPDFVAIEPNGGVRCWIEVELGPPDSAQLKAYRTTLNRPVICIAGTAESDLALGEIADAVSHRQPQMDDQQKVSAQVLLDLIEQRAGKSESWNYADPGERLKQEPLIVALAARLPDRLIYGTPPLPQGKVLVSTITQKGWTLRVYSHNSTTNRSFSVMRNLTAGGGVVHVPSHDWLSRYLPNGDAASDYAAWLAEAFEVDVSNRRDSQSARVPERGLLERVDELAPLLAAMSLAG